MSVQKDRHSSEWSIWLTAALGALAFVLVALSVVLLPPHPIRADLDGSWVSFLSLAAERGWHAGSDFVFTYGPLGSWLWPIDVGETLGWSAFLRGASAVAIAAYIWSEGRSARAILILVGVLYISFLPIIDPNGPMLAVGLVLSFALPARNNALIAALVVILTLWGLAKFSGLIVLILVIFWYSSLVLLLRAERLSEFVPKIVISVAAALLTVVIVYVVYLDEPVYGFIDYVYWSSEVSGGYTRWMAAGRRHGYLFGYLAAVSVFFLLHLSHRFWRNRGSGPTHGKSLVIGGLERRDIQLLLCAAPVLFIAFKQGFVRQDGHEAAAFIAAFVYASLVLTTVNVSDRVLLPPYSVLAVAWLCFALSVNPQSPNFLEQFSRLPDRVSWASRRALETVHAASPDGWAALKNRIGPRNGNVVAALKRNAAVLVEQESYDIFAPEQGLAWANPAGYKPRPVFQGYSAYTPLLQDLNAEHVETVPQAMLVKMQPIDGRFPNLEDGSALAQVVLQFCPIKALGSHVLFRRQGPQLGLDSINALDWRTVRLDRSDGVSLPGGVLLGRLELELSTFGKLLASLYRLPPIEARVTLSGRIDRIVRLVPTGRRYPALLSPWLETASDVAEVRAPDSANRLVGIGLVKSAYMRALVDRVSLSYAPISAETVLSKCQTPLVQALPIGAARGSLSRGTLGAASDMDAHPKRVVAFPLSAATHLQATIQLREPETTRKRSNGVHVRIYHSLEGRSESIVNRRVRPSDLDDDGRLTVYDGSIDLKGGFLVFDTDDANPNWDWYVWERVEIH